MIPEYCTSLLKIIIFICSYMMYVKYMYFSIYFDNEYYYLTQITKSYFTKRK